MYKLFQDVWIHESASHIIQWGIFSTVLLFFSTGKKIEGVSAELAVQFVQACSERRAWAYMSDASENPMRKDNPILNDPEKLQRLATMKGIALENIPEHG